MKEMLTFRGINVDVLKFTKVSAGTFTLETECLFTSGTHISNVIDTF